MIFAVAIPSSLRCEAGQLKKLSLPKMKDMLRKQLGAKRAQAHDSDWRYRFQLQRSRSESIVTPLAATFSVCDRGLHRKPIEGRVEATLPESELDTKTAQDRDRP